ncbi:MAG: transcription termination/antitermination NusG family protein, partial [Anaerolineae bacterium]|nr:transcription termination/antitermination NusG family protein [Anaerolineae bacterium]
MEQWYALHTKPNSERLVATLMTEAGIEVYLPELETRGVTGFKPKPFFPCYLFIKSDFSVVGLSTVRWTPGLRTIVSFDDRPISVPEDVI